MAARTLTLEIPEELVELIGSPEAAAKAREALILELLREARLSQGQTARLLGITRWELLDALARHHITSGPGTIDEMHQEIESVHQVSRKP